MKVMGRNILHKFIKRHADVRSQVTAWLFEAEEAQWRSPEDIKARYAHTSFLDNNVVVFNLRGNKYRLVVAVAYKNQMIIIKRIGTHAEYSRWEL